MKTSIHIITAIVLLSLISCANLVTIRNTEATTEKPASETVVVGTAVAAKQEFDAMEIITKAGAHIRISGAKQDSDDVPKAWVNWEGLGKVTGILEKTKQHDASQVTQRHGAEQATQQLTVKEGAGVVKHANGTNGALEIPAQIVTPKGY